MTQDNTAQPAARRVMMRRARAGGFAAGSSTQSESLRAPVADEYEPDDVDDAIDPGAVHREIVTRAQPRGFQPGFQPAQPPPPPSPSQRMHDVAMSGDAAFAKEYRLTMLHRLLLRRIPLDRIAAELGVSVSTVQKDRVLLKERLRLIARELDINEMVGNQTEVYNELSAISLKIATTDATPIPMKLAAVRTTLAAEADRTRFLNTAGVYDVLRFRKSEDGTDVSDIQQLMNNTDAMFQRLMADDAPPPPVTPRRTVRAAKPAGFGKMSMDNADASSGDLEEVEL